MASHHREPRKSSRQRTSIVVAAPERGRVTLRSLPEHEYGRMLPTHNGLAWLDRFTNPASPVRTDVSSPESSRERDDAARFVADAAKSRTTRDPGRHDKLLDSHMPARQRRLPGTADAN
jgi:hypothetical protein